MILYLYDIISILLCQDFSTASSPAKPSGRYSLPYTIGIRSERARGDERPQPTVLKSTSGVRAKSEG